MEALPAIALLAAYIDAREGRLEGWESKVSEGGDGAAISAPDGAAISAAPNEARAEGSCVAARGVLEPRGVFDFLLPPLPPDSAFLNEDARGERCGVPATGAVAAAAATAAAAANAGAGAAAGSGSGCGRASTGSSIVMMEGCMRRA